MIEFVAIAYAAEEVAPAGLAGTLGLNVKLFLAQLVNFGILATALWYLLFRPLTQHMADRSRRIAEGLDAADAADHKLKSAEGERSQLLARTEKEAAAMLARADAESSAIVSEAKQQAAAELDRIRGKATQELAAMKQQLLDDVRSEAADLVVLAAEKALRGHVDKKLDQKLIHDALRDVAA